MSMSRSSELFYNLDGGFLSFHCVWSSYIFSGVIHELGNKILKIGNWQEVQSIVVPCMIMIRASHCRKRVVTKAEIIWGISHGKGHLLTFFLCFFMEAFLLHHNQITLDMHSVWHFLSVDTNIDLCSLDVCCIDILVSIQCEGGESFGCSKCIMLAAGWYIL
ncbi:hypothetical protein KP509_33G059900 [Ceratopteris richardii]|uniref:Uncharacterized protein n=1 Tax=Ceratopteris richardii TaxID=49495 RepID=A0A8T2QRN3_CERRI|nr:hypothetical protein KP509_33G059900 [Ceratopteris richardii]